MNVLNLLFLFLPTAICKKCRLKLTPTPVMPETAITSEDVGDVQVEESDPLRHSSEDIIQPSLPLNIEEVNKNTER